MSEAAADDLLPAALRAELFADDRFAWKRWAPGHLFYRLRLGARRRRWLARNVETCRPYLKAPLARLEPGAPTLVLGDLSGRSGLSRASRFQLDEIRGLSDDLTFVDVHALLADERATISVPGRAFANAFILVQPDAYWRILPLLRPDQLAEAYRVGHWLWETPQFPQAWRFAADLLHEVWTPSIFCRDTFRKGLTLPVRLSHYRVDVVAPAAEPSRAGLGVPPEAFLGTAIMDIQSCAARKNPWAHVEAWQRAFGADPDKILILKIRFGKRTRVVQRELAAMIGEADNIRILEAEMSDEEVAALQGLSDVYLSLHAAEGYGLNIHEMLTRGVPVVATHWSANAEFGPRFPNYHAVAFELRPYRDWLNHYPGPTFAWAWADIAYAARKLRAIARDLRMARSLSNQAAAQR